jgi:hypothetical protein
MEPKGSFRVYDLIFCDILATTNNSVLCTVLLSSSVFELQRSSSSGIEPRTVSRDCDHCSCNILSATNNFALDVCLLSCLVSELQERPSPGLELGTIFQSFHLSKISSCSQGLSMPRLVEVGLSVLELQANTENYKHFDSFAKFRGIFVSKYTP